MRLLLWPVPSYLPSSKTSLLQPPLHVQIPITGPCPMSLNKRTCRQCPSRRSPKLPTDPPCTKGPVVNPSADQAASRRVDKVATFPTMTTLMIMPEVSLQRTSRHLLPPNLAQIRFSHPRPTQKQWKASWSIQATMINLPLNLL